MTKEILVKLFIMFHLIRKNVLVETTTVLLKNRDERNTCLWLILVDNSIWKWNEENSQEFGDMMGSPNPSQKYTSRKQEKE